MRSLPEASREEPSSVTEIVTAGLAIIGFIVCSVVLARVVYPVGFNSSRREVRCGWLILSVIGASVISGHSVKRHVRFTPESGHVRCKRECPLCAKSRHLPHTRIKKTRPLSQHSLRCNDLKDSAREFCSRTVRPKPSWC